MHFALQQRQSKVCYWNSLCITVRILDILVAQIEIPSSGLTVVSWTCLFSFSTGPTAGNVRGRLCSLHQPVPRLRAADADGTPLTLLLRPGYTGWIPRLVAAPPSALTSNKCSPTWRYVAWNGSACVCRHWSVWCLLLICKTCLICSLFAWLGSEMPRARNELQRTPNFMDLYHELEAMFVKPSAGTLKTHPQHIGDTFFCSWMGYFCVRFTSPVQSETT